MKLLGTRQESCITAGLVLLLASMVGTVSAETASAVEKGKAACYSKRLAGHKTTSGERYDPNKLTASSPRRDLLGGQVKVTNLANGKSVVLTVNDHMAGSKHRKIIMDISQEACKELDFPKSGEAEVEVEKQQ